MKLHCPDCGQKIPASDINLSTELARCPACDAVFSFRGALEGERRSGPQQAAAVPRPRRMHVEDAGPELRIWWRWFRPGFLFYAVFCVLWDGFLYFWYSKALSSPNPDTAALVFPVVHVLVGVALTYYTLCGFFNRTVVSVAHELRVEHKPLPWRGVRGIPIGKIRGLYVRLRGNWDKDRPGILYELRAMLDDDTSVTLMKLDEPDEAYFLEKTLEQRLGLPDEPVAGELRG